MLSEKAERDVLPHRQAVEESAALKQHAELATDLVARLPAQADGLDAVDTDAARVRLEKAKDALQQHRLAGTGAADDDHRFAWAQVEVNAIQDDLAAEGLAQTADADLRRRCVHFEKKSSVRT